MTLKYIQGPEMQLNGKALNVQSPEPNPLMAKGKEDKSIYQRSGLQPRVPNRH